MLEAARSRLLYRTIDAVVTAPLRPQRTVAAHVRAVLSPRSSNYDRVGSLVRMIDAAIPGSAKWASDHAWKPVELPFPASSMELLAWGSGATVYRVRADDGDRVVKFYRRSLGLGDARLAALHDEYRRMYDTACATFESSPGLVWPAEYHVLPGPIRGRAAVACVQAFIDEPMVDFFEGFDEAELGALLEASPPLREQFEPFAARTLELWRSTRRFPDVLGEHNLAVVGSGPDRRLRIIDYGQLDGAAPHPPGVPPRIEACVARIEALARGLGATREEPVGR